MALHQFVARRQKLSWDDVILGAGVEVGPRFVWQEISRGLTRSITRGAISFSKKSRHHYPLRTQIRGKKAKDSLARRHFRGQELNLDLGMSGRIYDDISMFEL
jgi:hypothetical protein